MGWGEGPSPPSKSYVCERIKQKGKGGGGATPPLRTLSLSALTTNLKSLIYGTKGAFLAKLSKKENNNSRKLQGASFRDKELPRRVHFAVLLHAQC